VLYRLSPIQMMLIGFVLLMVGFLLPFVMVLRIVQPTLLLGFVSYLASLAGLVIGLLGVFFYGRVQHKEDAER
jgi:hypothetical protein